MHLVLSTQAEPFEGEVVLRIGSAQVHRVPISLPARARREVTVGVLPFRPSERVEVEAGGRRVTFDMRVAAGPIRAAEEALLEAARRERGDAVVAVGEEDSALWEGFDEVLVSRATAERRWGMRLETDRAWVRPQDRPWGLVWAVGEEARRGIPSVQGGWTGRLAAAAWGPEARRRFLLTIAAILVVLVGGLAATTGREPRARRGIVGALVVASTIGAAVGPTPRPAVSAMCVVGPTASGGWQSRGVGCASRGSHGDVELGLPGLPRPVFRSLEAAQESRWGVVWGERKRLVFPSRAAGQGCWFEWQARAEVMGRVVGLRDGGAANETRSSLSPAVLLIDGRATVREALAVGESMSRGAVGPLPPPLTPSLLSSMDATWRTGRHLLGGMATTPPGLLDVDLVDGQTWLWTPLE